MRTTITIDDALVADLMRFSDTKKRAEAINRALAEWVRRKRIEKLKALRGNLDLAGPSPPEAHSWERFAGMFEAEPLFDEVLHAIEAGRREDGNGNAV